MRRNKTWERNESTPRASVCTFHDDSQADAVPRVTFFRFYCFSQKREGEKKKSRPRRGHLARHSTVNDRWQTRGWFFFSSWGLFGFLLKMADRQVASRSKSLSLAPHWEMFLGKDIGNLQYHARCEEHADNNQIIPDGWIFFHLFFVPSSDLVSSFIGGRNERKKIGIFNFNINIASSLIRIKVQIRRYQLCCSGRIERLAMRKIWTWSLLEIVLLLTC